MLPLVSKERDDLINIYKDKFNEQIEELVKQYYWKDDEKEYPLVNETGEDYIIAKKFYEMYRDKFNKSIGSKRFYLELQQSFLMVFVSRKMINGRRTNWLRILDKTLTQDILEGDD